MRRAIFILLLTTTVIPGAAAAADATRTTVRYVSVERVYLAAGRTDGLRVGDVLQVRRGDRDVARIELEYLADHSASCRVLPPGGEARPGDAAVVITRGPANSVAVPDTAAVTVATPPSPAVAAAPPHRRRGDALPSVRGRLSFQWLHVDDRGPADLDLDQPRLRFDLRSREGAFGGNFFRVRGTLRQNRRVHSYFGESPTVWRNRVYEVTFGRRVEDESFHYQLGRITSPVVSGFGQLDGLIADARLSTGLRLGAFAGYTPDPLTSAPRGAYRKTGGFLSWSRDEIGRDWDLVLAGVGEYHAGEVDREYLFVNGGVGGAGGKASLRQSAEIDVNRGWRRAAAGRRLGLSNLWTSLALRPARRWTVSLSYDRREPYRTLESRSLPDSLFRDAMRQGFRTRLRWSDGTGWNASADAGVRGGGGLSSDTWSWGADVGRGGLFGPGSYAGADVRGFSGPLVSGVSPSLRLSRSLGSGADLRVAAGVYLYDVRMTGRRTNRWFRIGADRPLGGRLRVGFEYERDDGDDTLGDRLRFDTIWRF